LRQSKLGTGVVVAVTVAAAVFCVTVSVLVLVLAEKAGPGERMVDAAKLKTLVTLRACRRFIDC